MDFRYTAQHKSGERINGKMTAESFSVAVSLLKNQGLLPLEIKPVKVRAEKVRMSKARLFPQKVTLKELAIFNRQLTSSLSAGILLLEALETIAEDLENVPFRRVIRKVIQDIRAGANFSSALAKFPEVFPPTMVAMVKAGEQTGSLDNTLANLAKYLENTARTIQRFKTAIRYPTFIFGFFIFTIFVVVFFIIPKFKAILSQAGISLPLLTRIVIAISEFMIKNIFLLISIVVILSFLFWVFLKTPKFRLSVDCQKLKIPILGKVIQKTLMSHFSRTLSILLSAGVGLSTALTISSQVTDNVYFKTIIERIRKRVISGFSLSSEMSNQKLFHKMFVKMIQIGERTGRLGEMFRRNADYYDEEVEVIINNFMSLIEPVLIVLIGGVVLIAVLALYLPVFRMAMIKR